jgi:hypothetical protein
LSTKRWREAPHFRALGKLPRNSAVRDAQTRRVLVGRQAPVPAVAGELPIACAIRDADPG